MLCSYIFVYRWVRFALANYTHEKTVFDGIPNSLPVAIEMNLFSQMIAMKMYICKERQIQSVSQLVCSQNAIYISFFLNTISNVIGYVCMAELGELNRPRAGSVNSRHDKNIEADGVLINIYLFITYIIRMTTIFQTTSFVNHICS